MPKSKRRVQTKRSTQVWLETLKPGDAFITAFTKVKGVVQYVGLMGVTVQLTEPEVVDYETWNEKEKKWEPKQLKRKVREVWAGKTVVRRAM